MNHLIMVFLSGEAFFNTDLDFADALLRPQDDEEEQTTSPIIAKQVRKRKLLTADSEIEISKKEYSSHLRDTSSILRKVSSTINTCPS